MPASTTRAHVYDSLKSLFEEIGNEKNAAIHKRADSPRSEPGSIGGETSHPSKNVDDRLVAEQTGSRFSENTKDVKEDVGSASVENAPEATFESGHSQQQRRQPDIGAHNAATGEDTSVERDFKGTKDDPGTTSKMKADDGEKYGGDYRSMPMAKIAAMIGELGEEILADVGNGRLSKSASPGDGVTHSRGVTQPVNHGQNAQRRPQDERPAEADEETKAAAAAGYDLARVLGYDEHQADAHATQLVAQIIKEASDQGDLVGRFIVDYNRELRKQAGGDPAGGDGESHANAGDASSGGGDQPPMGGDPDGDPAGGGPGGGDAGGLIQEIQSLPPEIQQQIMAALMQGGGGMGGDPSGGMGGIDPSGGMGGAPGGQPGGGGMQGMPPGMMGGMDPSGGAGGDPSGGMGGQPGAGMSPDQATDELSSAMTDMGTSPEELEQTANKAAAYYRTQLIKVANMVRQRRRAGKSIYKVATTPRQIAARTEALAYLAEIMGTAG